MNINVYASMTPADQNIGKRELTRRDSEFGYFGLSYHYVITRDGLIESGRPEKTPSPHGPGIAICLIGGTDEQGAPQDNFTPEQYDALRRALRNSDTPYSLTSKTPSVSQELLDKINECKSN